MSRRFIIKSTLQPAVGFVEEGGKFGILPDLLPEAFSEMLCEGLRCLPPVETFGQVGTDSPASVVAGGPARGKDILQQVGTLIREAQGQFGILVVLIVPMISQEDLAIRCFLECLRGRSL